MAPPSEKKSSRGSAAGADGKSGTKHDDTKGPAVDNEALEASAGKKILIGVATSVASALLIALGASFLVSQKNDVIQVLREELRNVRDELSRQISRERGDRRQLVIALREAGVNLPLDIILRQVADSGDSELTRQLTQEIVAQAPIIETEEDYEALVAKSESEGTSVPIFSTSIDGTRVLAFSDNVSALREAKSTNIFVRFNDVGVRSLDAMVLGSPEQVLTTPGVRASGIARLRSKGG